MTTFNAANYTNLFKNASNYQVLKKGSLITFNYMFWKHDPYPLLIVSNVIQGKFIKGVNLHYLTFPYIKNLIKNCNNPAFSYQTIKGDRYISNAFRGYKWNGIRQIKYLDCDFILNAMGLTRGIDVNQLDAIKKSVQDQVGKQMGIKAEDLKGING